MIDTLTRVTTRSEVAGGRDARSTRVRAVECADAVECAEVTKRKTAMAHSRAYV
jgi:hypothetical protein